MIALLSHIKDILDNNNYYNYLSSPSQNELDNQTSEFPYITFDITTNSSKTDTCNNLIDSYNIRFINYDLSAIDSVTTIDNISSIFLNNPIDLLSNGENLMGVWKISNDIIEDPDKTDQGQTVYQALLNLLFMVGK